MRVPKGTRGDRLLLWRRKETRGFAGSQAAAQSLTKTRCQRETQGKGAHPLGTGCPPAAPPGAPGWRPQSGCTWEGCANPQFCRLDFSPDTQDLTPGKELATLPWTLSPLPAAGGPLGQSPWDGGVRGTSGEARSLLSPIVATDTGGSFAQPGVQTPRELQGEGLCRDPVPTAGTETADEPQPPGVEAEPKEGALLGRGPPCRAHGPGAK